MIVLLFVYKHFPTTNNVPPTTALCSEKTSLSLFLKDFENKKLVVNYFKPTEAGVVTEDISSLDPGSDKKSVSEWGGLVEFTSKTNEIVAQLWR